MIYLKKNLIFEYNRVSYKKGLIMTKFEKIKNDFVQGIKHILYAFKHSYDGFVSVLKSEQAFRQDLCVFVLFTVVALLLNVPVFEKVVLVSSLFLILFAECVNTAIEVIVDRISKEIHPLSKKAKDIGSLIVLMAFVNAIVVWCAVLL